MAPKAKRRITNLFVEEVSLVDKPANEQEFMLLKSEDGSLPSSLAELIARAREPIAAATDTQKFEYFTFKNGGEDIEVDPKVERAFPGIAHGFRSAYAIPVNACANLAIQLELQKSKELIQ